MSIDDLFDEECLEQFDLNDDTDCKYLVSEMMTAAEMRANYDSHEPIKTNKNIPF